MIIFRVTVNSDSLTEFGFLSNVIINTVYFNPSLILLAQQLAGYWPLNILFALDGIWILNFLHFLVPPFCVSSGLNTFQVISLGYIPALYPLLLCIITYCLIELHANDFQLVGFSVRCYAVEAFPQVFCYKNTMEHTVVSGTLIRNIPSAVVCKNSICFLNSSRVLQASDAGHIQ